MARMLVLVSLLMCSASAAASTLVGQGRAIDGDSLIVDRTEVRLHGIDAPEANQTCTHEGQVWYCGKAAADQLSKLIAGQAVSCASLGQDRFGRTLGQCRAGDIDLNRTMVATGYALAYRRYSTTYVSAEESARLAKRGIWSGSFALPSEIRHAGEDYRIARPPAEGPGRAPVISRFGAKPQPTGNCRIKGNQSRRGERIYHLPGMRYYTGTVAEEIFCSEAQARAAGYRRSRADRHR